jgi:hypothetical protein
VGKEGLPRVGWQASGSAQYQEGGLLVVNLGPFWLKERQCGRDVWVSGEVLVSRGLQAPSRKRCCRLKVGRVWAEKETIWGLKGCNSFFLSL